MIIQVPGGSVRLDILCEFISLAHHLSFSTAAKELNISQPSLSKHISDLEKELGVTLLHRGRKTKLTAAGKIFSDYTLMMLHDYKQIVEKCRRIDIEKAEVVRIQRPFALDALSSDVLEFTRNYFTCNENLSFQMIPLRKSTPESAIVEGVLDLGFLITYDSVKEMSRILGEKGLSTIASRREPFALLASKNHPLAQKETITFEDIRSVPIQMTANSAFDHLTSSVQQMFVSNKSTAHLRIQTVDNLIEFLMMQKQDNSIYLFPQSMFNDATFSLRNDLVCKTIEDERCKVNIIAIASKDAGNLVLSAYLRKLERHLSYSKEGESPLVEKSNDEQN
ncbi:MULTISPECIES: LysR family transcriptional regulator [unclassified Adlercreutzia]|uniref:LysR family transcriptional regulator n=1 Tax=unclassified Adlercreutzia TaxID=2636013 RepID=UPI0013EA2EB4|nr:MULTISPECIES: LysR family transcriptional regulator [unclassified Adlercreutzia]